MSDSTPPDNSPSNSEGSGEAGPATGGDLDEVLANAEALAGELATELGAVEDAPHNTALDALTGVDETAVPTIDDELERLDELASQTAKQIGSASEDAEGESQAPDTPASPAAEDVAPSEGSEAVDDAAVPGFMEEFTNPPETDPPDAAPADSDAVPDFMAELTQAPDSSPTEQPSEPGSEPPSPPSQPETATPDEPGVVKSRPAGVIGNIAHPNSEEGTDNADASVDASAEGDGETQASKTPRVLNKLLVKLAALPVGAAKRLSPVALKVADKGVAVLEKADRPTAWLKVSIKQIAGLLAIATMGTSIIVFFVSLF